MAYKVIILYQLYMPSYFLGTFTEYPYIKGTVSILFPFSFYSEIGIERKNKLMAGRRRLYDPTGPLQIPDFAA